MNQEILPVFDKRFDFIFYTAQWFNHVMPVGLAITRCIEIAFHCNHVKSQAKIQNCFEQFNYWD